LRFLQKELCDEIQGYVLGRPASIETFHALTHRDHVGPDARQSSRAQAARRA
jgi:hypothetical protein